MSTEIKLPSLGEGVDSGDVLEILVKVGDVIKKDQSLVELETDKATVSVPSPFTGKILSVAVKEGETIKTGMVIATIEAVASAAPAPAPVAPPPPPAAAAPAPKPVETPKVERPAPQPVAPPSVAAAPQVSPQVVPPVAPMPIAADVGLLNSDDIIPAGPAIRRFAREVGVDLTGVTGTGEGGRITREDVLTVVRHANQTARNVPQTATVGSPQARENAATSTASKGQENALPGAVASDDYGQIRVERMSKIRKTIASQMHKSWSTAPRVVNFDDADVTELEAFRQSSKDDYAARGIKLTTLPFLVKAVASALKHHPTINATVDMENEQIIYRDYVNVGIAVDTDRGLVVPTLKNTDKLSIPDIAFGLVDLSQKVRTNNFGMSDIRGGTFTISNLGAIGGTYSTPIINVPEVAILLVGRTRKLPVVMEDDSIQPRLMMPLSLAYDHRLVDGGTAARFLNDVIAYLEAPSRLLLAI